MASGDEAMTLTDVADRIHDAADGETVSVRDMMDEIGQRAFGPLLLVFALIGLSPVGSIPGASVVVGSLIILIASQLLMRRKTPWIPSRLLRIDVGSDKVRSGIGRIRPFLARVDRLIRPRWQAVVRPPWFYAVPVACIALAALMYPLALVPWGVLPPVMAIAVLSLGLSAHDGLLTALGLASSAVALAASIYLLA
jgi:hypothetical protein